MVGLIIENIEQTVRTESQFTVEITVKNINEWKFFRWLELMDAYDDARKSNFKVNNLSKEIMEDYDKDFKEEEW